MFRLIITDLKGRLSARQRQHPQVWGVFWNDHSWKPVPGEFPAVSYLWRDSLQEEIKDNFHYQAKKIIVYPKRLSDKENHNFDIGLLKLDRYVQFSLDVSPICMDGFLSDFKPTDDAVYISGFGITLYKKGKKSSLPECSTNEFLPRPYHTCKVKHMHKSNYLTFLYRPSVCISLFQAENSHVLSILKS